MVARGRVQDGVVVLEGGVRLPEGQEVTVLSPDDEAPRRAPAKRKSRLGSGTPIHSILDILPVSLGAILRPLTPHDDLLGEMLEGRA